MNKNSLALFLLIPAALLIILAHAPQNFSSAARVRSWVTTKLRISTCNHKMSEYELIGRREYMRVNVKSKYELRNDFIL